MLIIGKQLLERRSQRLVHVQMRPPRHTSCDFQPNNEVNSRRSSELQLSRGFLLDPHQESAALSVPAEGHSSEASLTRRPAVAASEPLVQQVLTGPALSSRQ